jgi:hypothetical protein
VPRSSGESSTGSSTVALMRRFVVPMAGEEAGVRVARLARGPRWTFVMARPTRRDQRSSSHADGPLGARPTRARLTCTTPDRATASARTPRSPSRLAITSTERGRRPREEVRRWRPACAGTPRTPMPRAASASWRAATASCSSRESLSRSRLGVRYWRQRRRWRRSQGRRALPSPARDASVTPTVHRATRPPRIGLGRGTTTIRV